MEVYAEHGVVQTDHADSRAHRSLGTESGVCGDSAVFGKRGIAHKLQNGKLEIVVDADQPLEKWLGSLDPQLLR